jgi:hypothetical protein
MVMIILRAVDVQAMRQRRRSEHHGATGHERPWFRISVPVACVRHCHGASVLSLAGAPSPERARTLLRCAARSQRRPSMLSLARIRTLRFIATHLAAASAQLAAWRPGPVRACPDCSVGRAARAQLWSDDFTFNLAVTLLPFVLVIAASIWADRRGQVAGGEPE